MNAGEVTVHLTLDASQMAAALRVAEGRVAASATGMAASMSRARISMATSVLDATARIGDKLGGAIWSVTKRLGHMAATAGKAFGAVAIAGAGAAIKLAADWEQTNIAFTTMLGDAGKAKQMLKDIQNFAIRTPFKMEDVVGSSRLLMAYGFEAEKVLPTLEAIGNAAAALGLQGEGVQRMVHALGQMRAKGMVSGEEMRQLAQAGIPAWQYMAEILGTDIPTAMKMAEQRMIDGAETVDKLIKRIADDPKFKDMMKEQFKTLAGMWAGIRDAATITLRTVGQLLIDTFDIKDKAWGLFEVLGKLQDAMSDENGMWAGIERVFGKETKDKVYGFAVDIAEAFGDLKGAWEALTDKLAENKPQLDNLRDSLGKLWDMLFEPNAEGEVLVVEILDRIIDLITAVGTAVTALASKDWPAAWKAIKENKDFQFILGIVTAGKAASIASSVINGVALWRAAFGGAAAAGTAAGTAAGGSFASTFIAGLGPKLSALLLYGSASKAAASVASKAGLPDLGYEWGSWTGPKSSPTPPSNVLPNSNWTKPNYQFAEGGVARGPLSGYPAILHGTEAVVPLNKPDRARKVMADAGLGGVVINVTANSAGDIPAIKRAVREVLRMDVRSAALMGGTA